MPVQNHPPLHHSDQYNAVSACGHCDRVIRHEPWRITQNASLQYAHQAVSDGGHSSSGERLILHALGIILRRSQKGSLNSIGSRDILFAALLASRMQ
jgi:hypothetical protein